MSDDKTPVDDRYKSAVEAQKNGAPFKGPLRRFTFRGERADGIICIFNESGETVQDATKKAVAYCDKENMKYLGRVTSNRSAYQRVKEEG